MKQKIIDVHMHPDFDDKASIQFANEAGITFSLKGLLRDFKKHNIVKALALPRFTHFSTKEKITFTIRNDKIKKLISENNKKLMGACTISPGEYVHDDINMIENDIKKGIFKAIKLYPGYEFFYPNQQECIPIYELAKRNNIPVLFHTGDTWGSNTRIKYAHPLNVDDVAVSFPELKFVICHLGNPWIIDAVEILYKNENVYADLSGFIVGKGDKTYKKYCEGRIKTIMEGIYYDRSIVDKLLFGTDYPLTNYDFYIKFISRLDLSKKEFNKIFFENAAKLFNIKC